MASEQHLNLSGFIKKVHEDLRMNSVKYGPEKAWADHCQDDVTLSQYAQSMKELATNHWDRRLSKSNSRVVWSHETCLDYYRKRISDIRQKEIDIAMKLGMCKPEISFVHQDKFKLLDVGSCYDPFSEFICFDVTPVDIAPATNNVFKCDFLDVEIGEQNLTIDNKVIKLQRQYFDVVVFCLLLEYMPIPKQRSICCEKAYELLKTEGILIIISPDSNHVGSNAKLIKSWRFILAQMGFARIKYEKLPHVHCMAFRKSFYKEIPLRWADLHQMAGVYKEIFIPQDFKTKTIENEVFIDEQIDEDRSFCDELPFREYCQKEHE